MLPKLDDFIGLTAEQVAEKLVAPLRMDVSRIDAYEYRNLIAAALLLYGEAAARVERDRCAGIAEQRATSWINDAETFPNLADSNANPRAREAAIIATAIRKG